MTGTPSQLKTEMHLPGQRLVANQYDVINRTELENDDVRFEEPTWGEVIK